MGIKINVKHRIVINGRMYGSAEEIPPDQRRAYDAALAAMPGQAGAVQLGGRIRVNEREYGSVEEMPPEDRKLYELAMAAAKDDGAPRPARPAAPRLAPGEQPRSSMGLGKWLVVIGVAILLYLLARSLAGPVVR